MKRIISYFIKYPITGDVLILLILIFGVLGIFSMRSTFFPESESRLIVAQVVYPGASPEEVEEGIVAKIEDNLKGVTGIDRITSVSSENTGRVTVEGSRGYDVEVLLQDVKNAVDQINSFPVGIESPTIFKQEALTVALNFAISGNVDLQTLKRFARQIESDLLAKDGISKVSLNGFPEEEIEIGVREADLQTYGLSFDQVLRAVQAANLELTGGTIKTDVEELLIRSRNKEYYADDLLDVLVATAPDGRKVYLREVAEVRDKWVDTPNRLYVNGKPGVGINVSNTIDENLLDISTLVREHIAEFNERNDNIQAVIINDGSDVLNQRIDLLLNNGMVGIALVLLLLAMFLQVRLAFWVAIAIPISILGQFIIAPVIGVSINVLSLFGLILVIGILVDDGIVISENIYRHFEMGKDRMQAAIDGTMEVLPAVFSAILTTVVAFGSFLFLAGISGDFFSEMAIVVMLTLVFSLIEGAFILPGHVAHSKALTRKGEGEEVQKDQPESTFGMIVAGISGWFTRIQQYLWDFMEWMKNSLYAPFLRFFLRNPFMGLAVPLAILIFCFGLVGGGLVGVTFFPNIEANFVSTNLKMPSGVREAETQKWLDHIEAAIIRVNEDVAENRNGGKDIVTIITKNLGPAANEGSVLINLVDSENRPIKASEFSELVRKEVGTIYGAESFTIGAATPFGKTVSVALIGNQLSELDKAVNDLKAELSELADVRDITDTNQEGLREINVSLTDKARLLGLNLQTVIGQVRQGFFG
ncbi:MAG: efflux RND transporter permease subunit, partial [Bacteroidota bacterium]